MNMTTIVLWGSIATIALAAGWRTLVASLVVNQYEAGLLYFNGRFARRLEPGAYHLLRPWHTWRVLDLRKTVLTVAGQEVLSADNVGLKASLSVVYEIADPVAAAHETVDPRDHLYVQSQLALRSFVAGSEMEKLLSRRRDAGAWLLGQVAPEASRAGLKVHLVEIKDVMFPGELKNLFAAAVRARNEGQAALEKARAETAALRSLANAAALMENHPTLLSLRWIQALEGRGEKAGHTVVLGTPGGVLPIKESGR